MKGARCDIVELRWLHSLPCRWGQPVLRRSWRNRRNNRLRQQPAGLIAIGETLAEERCGRCHAIGTSDVSPHNDAPPFRVVASRYPVENLAESLAEGILVGHPDMPVVAFEPDELDAFLTYLDSLSAN